MELVWRNLNLRQPWDSQLIWKDFNYTQDQGQACAPLQMGGMRANTSA